MGTRQQSRLWDLRGYLTAFATLILFVCADLLERTIVVALIKLKPSARNGILHSWQRRISLLTIGIIRRIGGVPVEINPEIPWGDGVLVVMNHQSIIDIPLAFLTVVGGYSRIITRERYRSGLPLISHMIRLYDHPTVQPGERISTEIRKLRKLAVTSVHPIVIFPEGARSRDGEIGQFNTAGLRTLLTARTWKVHAVVVDGLWRATSPSDFARNVKSMRVRVEEVGAFDFNHKTDDAAQFAAKLEQDIRAGLNDMRRASTTHGADSAANASN
ncbi:MAG: 1-acyl-sn-glycerol-3-phosphate acyltransferase [Candidatus Latescibacterota bacterium]|nr:MAG: 1-acyl-sn-glycerol-3-phosphate acyltransferase [Candidatus Latescibacterota bacterium]